MKNSACVLSAIMTAFGATASVAAQPEAASHVTRFTAAGSEMQNETVEEFCRWHRNDTRYDIYCAPYND